MFQSSIYEEGINMVKPTKKQIKYFIADEKKAVKEYKKYGFPSLAKDEAKHRKFLMKKMKAMK
jgi:hypothetical protein